MLGSSERFSVTGNLTVFRRLFLIREKLVSVSLGQQCTVEGIDLLTRVAGLYKKTLSFGCFLGRYHTTRTTPSEKDFAVYATDHTLSWIPESLEPLASSLRC